MCQTHRYVISSLNSMGIQKALEPSISDFVSIVNGNFEMSRSLWYVYIGSQRGFEMSKSWWNVIPFGRFWVFETHENHLYIVPYRKITRISKCHNSEMGEVESFVPKGNGVFKCAKPSKTKVQFQKETRI